MTHRIPSERWQHNPERRVGQAQLNRVAKAERTGKTLPDTDQPSKAESPQAPALSRSQ